MYHIFLQTKTGKKLRNGHLENIRSANNVLLMVMGGLVATYRENGILLKEQIPFYTVALVVLILSFIYIRKQRI